MKKRTLILLLAALVLILTLLAAPRLKSGGGHPAAAADGAAWNESWEMVGPVLGLEPPGNGLTLLDNSVILTADHIFYATWTAGESDSYINEDGDEVRVYDAQLYMLTVRYASAGDAGQAVREWTERENDVNTVRDTRTETYNGQEYSLLFYDCASDTNPYQRGVAAFTVYGDYAVSAELTCKEGYEGDEAAILADVLSRCHYSADAP